MLWKRDASLGRENRRFLKLSGFCSKNQERTSLNDAPGEGEADPAAYPKTDKQGDPSWFTAEL